MSDEPSDSNKISQNIKDVFFSEEANKISQNIKDIYFNGVLPTGVDSNNGKNHFFYFKYE